MKKIAIVACLTALSISAFAQGTITWGNSSGTALKFNSDPALGGPNAGSKVFPGASFIVGLYLGNAGSTSLGAANLVATRTLHTAGTSATAALAGVFLSATYTDGTRPSGTPFVYQIKAWSAGYNSYEAALANPTLTTYAGASGIGGGALGGGASPAFSGALLASGGVPVGGTGSGAVNTFTIALVPEPASASLIGLGLASLLIFRRRK